VVDLLEEVLLVFIVFEALGQRVEDARDLFLALA